MLVWRWHRKKTNNTECRQQQETDDMLQASKLLYNSTAKCQKFVCFFDVKVATKQLQLTLSKQRSDIANK